MVALVLSNKDLNDTKIALLSYDDATKCLTSVDSGGNRRINVVRYGAEHHFICYGAGQSEGDGVEIFVNPGRTLDTENSPEDI
ncbi:MAG: hypothetical protein LBC35_04555 [Coriobacteriales bacterium]|nr:hypothetical protein [Coriobacteriales bacterium]